MTEGAGAEKGESGRDLARGDEVGQEAAVRTTDAAGPNIISSVSSLRHIVLYLEIRSLVLILFFVFFFSCYRSSRKGKKTTVVQQL